MASTILHQQFNLYSEFRVQTYNFFMSISLYQLFITTVTYIGNVVISVNPYKKLALYSGDVIQAYQSRSMFDLPPHIYAIADVAYRSMRDKNLDQCMIISGESGSGKTEASKLVMHYVAAVSGKGREVDCIKEQLLQSNPLLEAFGNAKTHCNDNSSRFGKYMDIEFDFKGDPIGGIITNSDYIMPHFSAVLLQSRVTNHTPGERNFHIFYQMLTGADIQLLKSLKLQRNIDNYAILRNRTCTSPQDINEDKVNFAITKRAMEVVGLSSEEIHSVFQMVSGVLKLGNIEFIPHANMDGTEGCIVTNEYEIYDICEVFGCDVNNLQSALTQRVIEARHEMIITDLTSVEATYGRDSLCKALYSRLFTWIVNRINDGIKVKKYGKRKALGVLDIYGFEVFEHNSFEQLIINYCNEKLQQIFIELTLKEEQEEYIREGIQWSHVDYFNNAVICDLIEKNNHGILATLDEECLRPGHVSDETFLHKLDQMCIGHPHYESRSCRNPNTSADAPVLSSDCFRIRHYAGTVTITYNKTLNFVHLVQGFIDKNSDLLYRDLSHAMFKCDHTLLKVLFPEGNPKRTTLKRPTTTGTQFKISIGALMKNLQSKCPNYIRCVKPNELKQPRIFEMALVQHQVRYLGLVENVRVRRAGYAYRQSYDQFLARYKVLSLHTWPSWRGLAAEGVTYLLRDLPIPPSEFAFGRSKLFIKNPRTLMEMEDYRRLRLDELATLIQKTYRGWKQRKKFLTAKNSQTLIAAQWRRWKVSQYYTRKEYLRMREAALNRSGIEIVPEIEVHCPKPKNPPRAKQSSSSNSNKPQNTKTARTPSPKRPSAQNDDLEQAREELMELRHKKKMNWAAGIIQKTYKNWKKRKYLLYMSQNLPSNSPIAREWPNGPANMVEISQAIRKLFHKWRCNKYRLKYDQTARNRMREKVTASIIFRDKKASYPRSVSHPFQGDYVRLRKNAQWRKICAETNDQYVVFADIINKVTRSGG
uniref:Myosin motor domain-containing protein n=1 Tax=Strigamia maritima TaxID=126957 RepID=T1IUX4_STRMM